MENSRVVLLCVAVFILGLGVGSNLPGLSIHGPPEPYSTNVKIIFSTHASCTTEVIRLIDGSNSTIFIAMYSFTNQDIADALSRAASRGVTVSIIGEPSQRTTGNMFAVLQRNENVTVKFDSGNGIMHNKFMIVDSVYVTTGSFNWSNSAENDNAENMLLMIDRPIAILYKAEWDWILANRT